MKIWDFKFYKHIEGVLHYVVHNWNQWKSEKNKNSAIMLEHALKGAASAGAEIELIHLTDLQFSGCKSCFACKLLNGKSFGRCYKDLVDSHVGTFNHFLGETSVVSTHETLQYDNYDLYSGDFNLELKNKVHEKVFPLDCRNAFEMGEKLVR